MEIQPPEGPNGDVQNDDVQNGDVEDGDVQNGSGSTDVQTFAPTNCVLNLTEDVLPLDITHHNSLVQTSTPDREDPTSYQTSKKSATPATSLASRRLKRCRKPQYIYSPSMH